MANGSSPPTFQHTAIEREPDIAGERRRGNPPPPPPRVVGRAGHANQVAGTVQGALSQAQASRTTHGVDPDRLLVLEFRSWDSGARDVVESRFGATVVDEQVETRPVERRLVKVPGGQSPDALANALAGHLGQADESQEQLRIRPASKADLEAAKKIQQNLGSVSRGELAVLERASWPASVDAALAAAAVQPLATLPARQQVSRVLVQFQTRQDVDTFRSEIGRYVRGDSSTSAMPPGERRSFFDALEWFGGRTRADRTGPRLAREGFPDAERFALDVDLWHSGGQSVATIINEIRSLCSRHGGRYVDDLRTASLILARIEATRPLAEALLDLDVVAQVNLPPVLSPAYSQIFADVEALPDEQAPTGSEPRVGVLDSGVLAAHPLLRGWVLDEVDFGTGEGTVTDQHGHGTQVAGLIVYGDVHHCLASRTWSPRVLVASGKVLLRGTDGRPVFPADHRPEKLVEDAIKHLHEHQGCRVFNLSLGNADDVYDGGRQFGWAELLDQLARELDVVIVVSAGNIDHPPLPSPASGREALQAAVRDARLSTATSRICSPGTASLAVTVGALARSDAPHTNGAVAAAPVGAPAPFSRVGPGYEAKDSQRAVKPDLVAYGGNFGLRTFAGGAPRWMSDYGLGEPTTGLPRDAGRYLTSVAGTSFAAPHVAHAAALAMEASTLSLGADASANAVRALLGACSVIPECPREWLLDPDGKETWDKLRLVGYGALDVAQVERSLQHGAVLMAEDAVAEDNWHVYSVKVPPAFFEGRGRRGIVVSVAYDPPVRASRKDYLARTMWVEVLKGISATEIAAFRGRRSGPDKAPTLPTKNVLDMRPAKGDVVWSTLQVRRAEWTRAPRLPLLDGESDPSIHILVGCQQRFSHGEGPDQWYGLATRFWHEDTTVEIHQQLQLQNRVRPRVSVRARVRQRG